MTNKVKYITLSLALCCVAAWSACTQQRQICLTPKTAKLSMNSLRFVSGSATPVDTALPRAVFIALTDSGGLGKIYGQASTFTVTLSPVADSCMWLFSTDSFVHGIDTLTFRYTRNLEFLSNACGYTYFYTLRTVGSTHTNVDSVRIINQNVTNDVNTKHLQVYIHADF